MSNLDEDGHVVFVINCPPVKGKKNNNKLVGFSNGVIKLADFDRLDFAHVFKVPLNSGEKVTCGCYAENGHNFLFGTN